jgi:broad specificity phosphatase PhoE
MQGTPSRARSPRIGPQIILCRHGETALNLGTERIRGWQDVPLDPVGQQKTAGLAQDIAEHQPAVLFTSDLSRAVQTAQATAEILPYRAPMVRLMELRPWNVGQLTGLPVEQIKGELLRLLKAKNEPAPGGESYAQFAERYIQVFLKVADFARKLGKPVAEFTHSRDIRLTRALLDGGLRKALTEAPDKVLLRDEDPVEPAGHAVVAWNGRHWVWDDTTDQIHTPESAPKAGRSIRRHPLAS